jgi:radical SAM protein with 4Fe4S-binding SPASM domain
MELSQVRSTLIPRLQECGVISVTLTGGEPFVHPEIIEIIRLFRDAGIRVGVCTNATLIKAEHLEALIDIGDVHFNVSLDGFRPESHGRFRGAPESFYTTVETIKFLGGTGLLQGLLVTPNNLAQPDEYREICEFAASVGAEYVLMNPLSSFGRGVRSKNKLQADRRTMNQIRELTLPFRNRLDVTYIRFPNHDLPLSGCEAKSILYVFANGDVTVCPYLVFAARVPGSAFEPGEFIPGNIFADLDIAERVERYRFEEHYRPVAHPTCRGCHLSSTCGKGCPAAAIADGARAGEPDWALCPASLVVRGEEDHAAEG